MVRYILFIATVAALVSWPNGQAAQTASFEREPDVLSASASTADFSLRVGGIFALLPERPPVASPPSEHRRAFTVGTPPSISSWVLVLVLSTIFWGTITVCLLTELKLPAKKLSSAARQKEQQQRLETLMTKRNEISVIPTNRVGTIDDIHQRISEASNVNGFLEGLSLRWRTAGAVTALKAQMPYAQAVVESVGEQAKMLEEMDRLFDAALQVQMRRDLSGELYDGRAEDEREKLREAEHKRTLAQVRRQKEEQAARRELETLIEGKPAEVPLSEEAQHAQNLGRLRREKEALEAQREVVSAKHGLEAEHTLKPARFELGRRRLEGKIAEVEVGVAVARNAAGQDANPAAATNESIEVGILHQLIQTKQNEIEQAEADGRDSTVQRDQLAKLKELLSLM